MSWEEKTDSNKAPEVKAEAEKHAEVSVGKVETQAADTGSTEVKDAPVQQVEAKPEVKAEAKEEPKVEAKAEVETLVPQKLIGKVAKAIREKSNDKIRALEEENRRLKEAKEPTRESDFDPRDKEEEDRIAIKVREEFLKKEDSIARKKYGQGYIDALDLIKAQNDPALVAKIQWAANPTEVLFEEASRIAENVEYGSDPNERERKKELALEEKIRKKVEAEFSAKLKALNNQPTDVQNVRAAGGNETAKYQPDTWATTLPK